MDIFLPFQLAIKTPIGQFFFFLSIALAFLTSFYFFLKARLKQKDTAAFYFEEYFSKIEEMKFPFSYSSSHRLGFLGRETLVQLKEGKVGLLNCYYPTLISSQTIARFEQFNKTLEDHSGSSYYCWTESNRAWMSVDNRFFSPLGQRFMTLHEVVREKELSQADKEWILLELAKRLAPIHKNLNPELALHGFFHPHNIYVTFDAEQCKPNQVLLSNAGVYAAVGAEKFSEHIQGVIEGRFKLSESLKPFTQGIYFAPEQYSGQTPSQVSYKSDLYLFGLTAYYLFTKQAYFEAKENWDLVPEEWHSFLKRSLSKNVSERPEGFDELLLLLKQPELELVFAKTALRSEEMTGAIDQLVNLKQAFQNAQQTEVSREEKEDVKQHFDYAKKLFGMSKWDSAKREYEQLLKNHPDHALVLTNLAICCFELKDYDLAREFYTKAKQINAQEARRYREHILS